jgi:hypothetical protein
MILDGLRLSLKPLLPASGGLDWTPDGSPSEHDEKRDPDEDKPDHETFDHGADHSRETRSALEIWLAYARLVSRARAGKMLATEIRQEPRQQGSQFTRHRSRRCPNRQTYCPGLISDYELQPSGPLGYPHDVEDVCSTRC